MKLFKSITITIWGVGLFAGSGVLAGEDMVIGFRGMLAVRATAGVAAGTNMQTFTGALGGAAADPITATGDSARPFEVDGSTFTDFSSAVTRSCNNQHNACADAANNGGDKTLTVSDCDTQQTQCLATQDTVSVATSAGPEATDTATVTVQSSAATATESANQTVKSADAEFFYICDT